MRNLFVIGFISACGALPAQMFAQSQTPSGSVADVQFIQGSWKASPEGRLIDAVWSAPSNGNMVGYVRVMKDGKASLYELFAFEETDNGLVALVKHFKPGLIGLEEKEKPDHYQFLEASPGKATFEKQGEATRVLYEKRPGDQFAIVIGKMEGTKWVYKDFWVFSKTK